MAAAATKNIQLALALPARLRTFLARYPPASILPETHQKTAYQEETPNPFMPLKHPATGRWHDPKYSLRRQAELVKMARQHGVEELLPYTPKGTETRLRKRVELGLRVKGTGVGQKVKGHKHERQLGVKYVWVSNGRVWLGGGVMGVHTDLDVQQDGEEETGHVGYAGAHQGMEEEVKARDWLQILFSPKLSTSPQHHQLITTPTKFTREYHHPPPPTMPPTPQNPTYYEILNLSPSTLSSQEDANTSASLLKRAYHRALLTHHPDKTKSKNPSSTTPLQVEGKREPPKYTIDQISTAYATLSRPTQRQAYDRSLIVQSQQAAGGGIRGSGQAEFQTGIEAVDLDDLDYQEELDGTTTWYRSCRCGNPRGYHFTEADLADAGDVGELMVGCVDCSLWLRVYFAVLDEEDDDDSDDKGE
ncbi:hypothetical protein C8A01DRAFT_16740 [Parachaetomium inaequale]|uniref:Diphthamide biosynthesis protein 4 n=1 Tax=Parachaetomium inaequale TaxID=2588326 RepID=A0AAN6PIP7_9PEZI|nr:hypothetical protein C8A01DRAFT_16740 [Parachaetomium inaequale]